MLELVHNQKNNLSLKHDIVAADETRSQRFIDDIINHIKMTHAEPVWNAQIDQLINLVLAENTKKLLKAL